MQRQFVNYEIALKLKELGFDTLCLAMYIDKKLYVPLVGNFYTSEIEKIYAPLWQQAINWFRKKHNIVIIEDLPKESFSSEYPRKFTFNIIKIDELRTKDLLIYKKKLSFDSYEEARKQAILEAIKIVNDGKE